MITIDIDDREVIAALGRLRDKAGEAGMRPALSIIGELLTETTKQRFASSTAPDGSRWEPNAPSTLARLFGKGDGGAGKRPLVDTGQLARTVRYQLIPGGVEVGTDRFSTIDKFVPGAAVHQFGSEDGHIPARPFLGLSNSDRDAVLSILARHLAD